MLQSTYRSKKPSIKCIVPVAAVTILLFCALTCNESYASKVRQKTFSSPEQAVGMMVDAMKSGDASELTAIFGPAGKELFSSGDGTPDKLGGREFVKAYEEKNRFEPIGKRKMILHVGKDDWSWPIPIVKAGEKWHFDTREGRREVLARRIGENELSAIQVCLAYVDAQREYAQDSKSSGMMGYARRFFGDPGQRNGLCRADGGDSKQGSLGPLVGNACKATYKGAKETAQPYHGYYYEILKKQGMNAPGGAYDYVVDGKMIGGFALVAYPAQYGNSGIMSFIVNQEGVVYEKDLGKNTEKIAEAMTSFDPDRTWKRVK